MFRNEYTEIDRPRADDIVSNLVPEYGDAAASSVGFSDHSDQFFNNHPHPLLPTIGIEIELPHRQLDTRLAYVMPRGTTYSELGGSQKVVADQIFADIDVQWGPRIEALKAAGLFIGGDSFAEVISPAYSYNGELRKLTDYLFGANFLPSGGELPMHLTLGNIDANAHPLQAQYLARMLEILDGSTDRRMHDPLMGTRKAWTQKNSAGFLFRRPYELAGSDNAGIEFRALTAREPRQVAKVLWRAQWLGASMKAWIEASDIERQDSVGSVPFDDYERGYLIDVWSGMVDYFDRLYEHNGLSLRELWGGPKDNPQSWTGHLLMCSAALVNQEMRKQLCSIVDSSLQEVGSTVARYYSSHLQHAPMR